MSSECLDARDAALFRWHAGLAADGYALAHYRIETAVPPDLAALGMAREQSACATRIAGGASVDEGATARVVDVRVLGRAGGDPALPPYRLATPVYAAPDATPALAEVTLAFPVRNLGGSIAQVLNHVFGELPRLGFLRSVRLESLDWPAALLTRFAGPALGTPGLRDALAIPRRPLLCRSARPAVGLSTAARLVIDRDVLHGGFDLIKDDELTPDDALAPTAERWPALAQLTREVAAATGERKGFIANLCDLDIGIAEAARRARGAGAFGALVAPGFQGFGTVREVERAGLAALAHNTGSDALTRASRVGIAPSVWLQCCRLAGADFVMLPGEAGTDGMTHDAVRACVAAAAAPLGATRPSLPVLAGGKQAQRLAEYLHLIGSADFMLIVASAVDDHPQGPRVGARAFRDAWTSLQR